MISCLNVSREKEDANICCISWKLYSKLFTSLSIRCTVNSVPVLLGLPIAGNGPETTLSLTLKVTLFQTYRTPNTCESIACTTFPSIFQSELPLLIWMLKWSHFNKVWLYKVPLVHIRQEYFTNTLHITLQFETLHFISVYVYFR